MGAIDRQIKGESANSLHLMTMASRGKPQALEKLMKALMNG